APCPTCPGARAGPGGASAFPEPSAAPRTVARGGGAAVPAGALAPTAGGRGNGPALRLSREPALTTTAASTTDELAARATRLLARVEWPGKPGATPITPLTADEQKRFESGREIYASVCAACHQMDGRGRADV